jgi:hypothetical protein
MIGNSYCYRPEACPSLSFPTCGMRAHKTLGDFQNVVSTFPISPFFPKTSEAQNARRFSSSRPSPRSRSKHPGRPYRLPGSRNCSKQIVVHIEVWIDDPGRSPARGGSIGLPQLASRSNLFGQSQIAIASRNVKTRVYQKLKIATFGRMR